MIHTKTKEYLTVNKIYEFLTITDKSFPVPISEKTDLMEFAAPGGFGWRKRQPSTADRYQVVRAVL